MFIGTFLMILFLVVVAILIVSVWWFTRSDSNQPHNALPGPTCLPIIGYLPFLTAKPYKKFAQLSHQFGPIFTLRVGSRRVLVLNDREVIKEAFNRDISFAGRPNLPSWKIFAGCGRFSFRTADSRWRFLRKTSLKALSLFASSRNSKLDAVVREGSESLAQDFLSKSGRPFDPKLSIFETVAAIIGSINFGLQFNRNDELLGKLLELNTIITKSVTVGSLVDYLLFGNVIFRSKLESFRKALEPLDQLIEGLIGSHVCNDKVRDVADALNEASKDVEESEAKAIGVTEVEIKNISNDLFAAGFATIMETARWAIALLANHPDKQTKLQTELDSVLQGRVASLLDRDKLPYTDAILLEVLRYSSLLPFGIPHYTMSETELRGYHITKDMIVLANQYAVNYDPNVFPNPEKFQPERFLMSNGTVDTDLAQLIMAFGVGKRRCAGENLARQELFLLLAHLFQKFCITPDKTEPIDTVNPMAGFARLCKPYKVVAVPR